MIWYRVLHPPAPSRYFITTLRIGLFTGVVDGVMVHVYLATNRGLPYLSPYTDFYVIATWVVFCFVAAVVLAGPGLRRFSTAGLLIAGPGLLLVSRAEPFLRTLINVPSLWIGVWLLTAAAIVAAVAQRFAGRMEGLDRYTVGVAVCGTVLLAVAATAETRARPRGASTAGHNNVLLVFLDTTRYDALKDMPNLAHFASTAVVFDNAWSPACWTLPSHFAVFTGLDPWTAEYDVDKFQFHSPASTLAQRFASNGYSTAAIFANPLLTPGTGLTKGFEHVQYSSSCGVCRTGLMYLVSRVGVRLGKRNHLCDWMVGTNVVKRAVGIVRQGDRPYFIAMNLMDPHAPYYVEPNCRGGRHRAYNTPSDREMLFRAVHEGRPLPQPVIARTYEQYKAVIRCMDRSLGELIAAVESAPDAEQTIIAVVADHGEQFGEHSLFDHGNSVYRQLLHVPLLLKAPGQRHRIVAEPVSTTALYSTLLELTGVSRVKRQALLGSDSQPCASDCGKHGLSVADSRYHLIWSESGRELIFDYVTDPEETAPLQTYDENAVNELRKIARRSLNSQAVQRPELRSLPYLQ